MNLPPWLCNKCKYITLSTLVSGTKQLGDRIDVFLQPLIEDLQLLWQGVEIRDAVVNQHFILHVVLMATISDNLAHRNLFGHSKRKGQGCSHCLSEICSLWLKNLNKFAYMGHRRWLPKNYPYRSMDRQFDGTGWHEIHHHISQVRMCTGRLRMSVQFSANGNVELIKEVMMIVMMKGSGIRNPYYGS